MIAFLDYVFLGETITEPAKLVVADGDLDGCDCVRVYGLNFEVKACVGGRMVHRVCI